MSSRKHIEDFLPTVVEKANVCPICQNTATVTRFLEERSQYDENGFVISVTHVRWNVGCHRAGCNMHKETNTNNLITNSLENSIQRWNFLTETMKGN